jgi:hypothetical protein
MRLLPALGLLAAALLLLGIGARAVAPREATDPEGARVRTLVLPPPAPPPGRIAAVLPRRAPVRARTGDIVTLAVRGFPRADVLEVAGLRHQAHIGPGVENRLTFVADRAGRFPLAAEDAGTRLGVLVVRAR